MSCVVQEPETRCSLEESNLAGLEMLSTLRARARDLVCELCATGTDKWEARFCVALCLLPIVTQRSALFNVAVARGIDSSSPPVLAAANALIDAARPWSRPQSGLRG